MKEKICFVIMGFGKKTDFATGNTFDLDKAYAHIIQPALVQTGYRCVRAIEVQEGHSIDPKRYALLVQADLVIADFSSYNSDVIYELGVRNAVRPFSTIIIKEKGVGKMPFDLDHRMFTYSPIGQDTTREELVRSVGGLTGLINKVASHPSLDTSYQGFISQDPSLNITEGEYLEVVCELEEKEKGIHLFSEKARRAMEESDFENAARYWEKTLNIVPRESYFKQQWALSVYKSQVPSPAIALTDALVALEGLYPTNDPETLGITAAIYKNIYWRNGDVQYLNRAIDYYSKGFNSSKTYYHGENYALCLNIKASIEKESDEKIYYKVEATKTRDKIIELLEEVIQSDDFDQKIDKKWMYATLANCYFSVKDDTAVFFEKKFLESALPWEKQTYHKSKEQNKRLFQR